MPAIRTQIYLTPAQRQRLDELTHSQGRTLAELVREAVDGYLRQLPPTHEEILRRTRGSMPELKVPSRDEWDRGR